MLVWVAFSDKPVNRREVSAQIDALARESGANFLEFWTVRKGFNRVAQALGYASRSDVWKGVNLTVWSKPL